MMGRCQPTIGWVVPASSAASHSFSTVPRSASGGISKKRYRAALDKAVRRIRSCPAKLAARATFPKLWLRVSGSEKSQKTQRWTFPAGTVPERSAVPEWALGDGCYYPEAGPIHALFEIRKASSCQDIELPRHTLSHDVVPTCGTAMMPKRYKHLAKGAQLVVLWVVMTDIVSTARSLVGA